MAFRALSGLKQLRLVLCQSSAASNGVRQFLLKNYASMGGDSPRVIVRQCHLVEPYAIANFGYGLQKQISLKNLTAEQIQQKLNELQALSKTLAK